MFQFSWLAPSGADEVFRVWDPAALHRQVIESQRRRLWLAKVLSTGRRTPWDWQPMRQASRQYMRNAEVAQKVLIDGLTGSDA